MVRNFICPNTGEPCADERCKQTRCVLDVDADVREVEQEKARITREQELQPLLKEVARDYLRIAKGIKRDPDRRRVNKLMLHPVIRDEANRRFDNPRYVHWANLDKNRKNSN